MRCARQRAAGEGGRASWPEPKKTERKRDRRGRLPKVRIRLIIVIVMAFRGMTACSGRTTPQPVCHLAMAEAGIYRYLGPT